MHSNYKHDASVIKNIFINKYHLKVTINFYDPLYTITNFKQLTLSLLIIVHPKNPLCRTNVVYYLSCPLEDCIFKTNDDKTILNLYMDAQPPPYFAD